MDKKQTRIKKIHISGIVQGVGFRPLTFHLAKKHHIHGTVQNLGGVVEIITESAEEDFGRFLNELKRAKSGGCKITRLTVADISDKHAKHYDEFKIIESSDSPVVSMIPPDFAVCDACRAEMNDPDNRRYRHPLISCMHCGPRYTIMDHLPYDRDTTVMEDFPMCPQCESEYRSPSDRRFHAQTISCHDCGPQLLFSETGQKKLSNGKSAYERAVSMLRNGRIIAVKGVGGYHFVCSPFREETVQNLRKLKAREEKPFAVMFTSIEEIRQYCTVTKKEQSLLESSARPIVLLASSNEKMAPSTYKGSEYCGAFLPYTPLQIMLLGDLGPLIMTSANLSDQPIIKSDEKILSLDDPLLSGVLYHKRRILRSVDDSVARIVDHKLLMIKRSRGYVPYPVFLPVEETGKNVRIFAAGGDLKAAFCLYEDGRAVVSQYFGDLVEAQIFKEYQNSMDDLRSLLQMKPDLAVCDLHPRYLSARYAKTLGIPVFFVQHHHAHIASVMAEHHLTGKVLGIAFDGTGYGTDGNIWGSEFMICQEDKYQRVAHLQEISMLGGDSSMRDAKKTATCFLLNYGLCEFIQDSRCDMIKKALDNHINTVFTSSMGRLFDAVSSILGIAEENTYEGKCAIFLEKEAHMAQKEHLEAKKMSFDIMKSEDQLLIDPAPVLKIIAGEWHNRTKETETDLRKALALGFHEALADMILVICENVREEQGVNCIAISGGVFQNVLLTTRVIKLLKDHRFEVFRNEVVPPGDGSISLGQTYLALAKIRNSQEG